MEALTHQKEGSLSEEAGTIKSNFDTDRVVVAPIFAEMYGNREGGATESPVDMIVSIKAKLQMNQLLSRVTTAYTERKEFLDRNEDRSTVVSYKIQEGIGQIGLFHSVLSFMNIACIGHPFLQYDAFVNKSFLKKYKIKMGCTYVKKRNSSILSDFLQFVHDASMATAGGDGIKTAEAAQWILYYPKSVAFLGSSCEDEEGEDVVFSMQNMNLAYKLETKKRGNTSIKLVIRFGKKWSEVYIFDPNIANLSLCFIDRSQVANLLERAQLIFICGQSCLVLGMALSKLAYFTSSRFKTLCIQVSEGISLAGMEKTFTEVIKYIHFLFLSRKSALMLIKVFKIKIQGFHGFGISTQAAAISIIKWIRSFANKSCTVIIYDSIKSAYVTNDDGKQTTVQKFVSKFYQPRDVVDLYGCENAFAGGYVAQLVQHSDVHTCVDCGFFCASAVATQQGAAYPVNRMELLMLWLDSEEQHKVHDDASFFSQSTPIKDGERGRRYPRFLTSCKNRVFKCCSKQ